MRKRKTRVDHSSFTMSLFEFSERAEQNSIRLDVDEHLSDEAPVIAPVTEEVVKPKIGDNFKLDGHDYAVVKVADDYSVVEDMAFKDMFGISVTQRILNELIVPNICVTVADTQPKSAEETTILTPDTRKNDKEDKVVKSKKKVRQKPKSEAAESLFDLFEALSQPSSSDVNTNETTDRTIAPAPIEKTDYSVEGSESYFTVGERISANIEAIKLLKKLKEENRLATPDEMSILNGYTGWGGLQDVFDESKNNVHYKELRELLSPEEYHDAARSMLDAYYTPYPVINSIYKCLKKAGFNGGRVLEPSCGTGRFFGLMPTEIRENSNFYGIELDGVTADIAKQLYQKANIRNCGFEDVNYGDNVFDLVITNVPYGDTPVADSRYNRWNFKIHDYFISKMIDVVRPGGIVVALTSSYSMDKNNQKAREYWAQRADLVGAYRLPNSTFKNAHTDVVADVLIFKKREERLNDVSEIEWIKNTTITVDGVDSNINMYFVNHSDCVLGEHTVISGPFGKRVTVEGSFESLSVIENAKFDYESANLLDNMVEVLPEKLMDEPDYCYCLYEGDIVFKQNGVITHIEPKNQMAGKRIRNLISLRKTTMQLITAQVNKSDDMIVSGLQQQLNREYDAFVKKYGYISSRANSMAFGEDKKYPLLCSLEIFNDEGEFERKADIFTQRTIKSIDAPKAENEQDALDISIAEKGCIDFAYMQSLTGLSKEEIIKRLQLSGRLFKVPFTDDSYETSECYLSGYVKKKLAEAKIAAQKDSSFEVNVTSLEAVQPKDIPFNEIYCPLGATWVPSEVYQEFAIQLFDIPKTRYYPNVTVSVVNHQFYISDKEYGNVKTTSTYGTSDNKGLELFEDCLNLISKKVYDYIEDADGKIHAVVNVEKTQVVQNKQELIKQQWNEWVWSNLERRQTLVRIYNDQMNDLVQPEYDGSKLRFPGISANIELMPHQKNAALRIIRTGNTLLAHVVGAGKTFSMIAAAMERKRLGLSNKPCFVVPNHLVEQWAGEINRLYPFANVLITKKKDFQKQNRKKFCAKISTGNWDAIILSHSQFSRIPLSIERQVEELEREKFEILTMLSDIDDDNNMCYQTKKYTRRQFESRLRDLTAKVEKLMDSKHDDTVTFEELGIDLLFLDEAHLFKNLQIYTKLQNVAGLTNAVSKKATDLLMKIHYLNEITNYQGVVFATGTPISNAVCELYVMQKYLQEKDLHAHGIYTFDSWISRFSETENKIEVKPEGTGYRSVTRVSRYHNLPELMNIFKLIADIRVADQLDLDVPERRNHNIAVEPSKTQTEIVKSFADRAEEIRSGNVDSSIDNMLCVTNDGRKVAIDQRLYDLALPDDNHSKLNRCIRTVYRIWKITKAEKATQLVFCDMGTPKKKANSDFFDLYNDVKKKLIAKGIPESEIAFIHDANTDQKKLVLFDKVNRGEVRVLLGSTEKLGAGTNVQKRLIAIHNIDCPWRPSDLEQRAGRIVRQGNSYKRVHVYTYVTKNTFDTYLYQTVLAKAEFIAQIMSSKTVSRDMDDIDSACLNYAEIKALSTGNPAIKEKMELEERYARLKVLRANHITQMYDIETSIKQRFPNEIKATKAKIFAVEKDIEAVKSNPVDEKQHFAPMTIGNVTFTVEEKKEAAELLLTKITKEHDIESRKIGSYRGFDIFCQYNIAVGVEMVTLYSPVSGFSYRIELGDNALGNITRLNNSIDSLPKQRDRFQAHLEEVEKNLETAKSQLDKPFEKEAEYQEVSKRLRELNAKLSVEGAKGLENIA